MPYRLSRTVFMMLCLQSPEGGDSGFKVNRLLLQSVLHMSLRPLGKPRGNQVTATACFYM